MTGQNDRYPYPTRGEVADSITAALGGVTPGTPAPTGPNANALGTSGNMVTDPAVARPTGLTQVWWATATQPANFQAGDMWVRVGS